MRLGGGSARRSTEIEPSSVRPRLCRKTWGAKIRRSRNARRKRGQRRHLAGCHGMIGGHGPIGRHPEVRHMAKRPGGAIIRDLVVSLRAVDVNAIRRDCGHVVTTDAHSRRIHRLCGCDMASRKQRCHEHRHQIEGREAQSPCSCVLQTPLPPDTERLHEKVPTVNTIAVISRNKYSL